MHNLALLRTQAELLSMRVVNVLPRENRADRTRFERFKEGYVKARYSKHYRVSEDELAWLNAASKSLVASSTRFVRSVSQTSPIKQIECSFGLA